MKLLYPDNLIFAYSVFKRWAPAPWKFNKFYAILLSIMFHVPMGRNQLESKLELPLFWGFTVLLLNSCVRPCRSFVILTKSSAGFVGCRSLFCCDFFCVFCRRQKKLRQPTIPAEDVRTTKGLQEWTQLYEWDDGETWK